MLSTGGRRRVQGLGHATVTASCNLQGPRSAIKAFSVLTVSAERRYDWQPLKAVAAPLQAVTVEGSSALFSAPTPE